ncbi:MAG: hypothetical protein ACYCO0_02660 [Candidatus Micrarchaeaceae archaeon]
MDSAVREPSRRMLEKRYGSVKALLRDRAGELGSDMRIKPRRVRRVEDISRLVRHIEVYDGTLSGLMAANIRNVVNLYEVDLGGEKRDMHVLWAFDSLGGFTKNRHRYNEFLRRPVSADILYRDRYSNAKYNPLALGYRKLEKIYSDPSLMAKIDGVLLDAYAEALKFYHWRVIPSGLVIGSDNGIACVPMVQMSEYGNDALGIIIGKVLIDKLIEEYKKEDYEGIRMAVTAVLVHELAHLHRNDSGEIATYAMGLMIEPHRNPYTSWTAKDIDDFISIKDEIGDNDMFKKLDDSQFERYLGLMMAMNEFAKYNQGIRKLFESSDTKYKMRALRDSLLLIRKSDVESVIGSGFVEKTLDGDLSKLVEGIDIVDLNDWR